MVAKATTNGTAMRDPRDVVEALGSPGAAAFMSDVLEEAHDALKASWAAPVGEGETERPLTPTQKGSLRLLLGLRSQLVTATTATPAPTQGNEK